MENSRNIGPQQLLPTIVGLDVYGLGALRLDRWKTQLPLDALSQDILDYIASHGGGSGSVADAINYRGGISTSSAAEATVCSVASGSSPAGYKLRGFVIYGTDDALVKLKQDSTILFEVYLHQSERSIIVELPNPEPITTASNVVLTVTPADADSANWFATILGE